MIKIVELIIVVTLLIFSFLAGVKYADSVKSHVSWLFENKEEEIELPDLSNENAVEITAPVEGSATEGEVAKSPENQSATPAEGTPASPAPAESNALDSTNTQPKVELQKK
jgi:hypothetical protein